ncbi:MAG: hypothetical protein SVT56_02640 [Chloroflexota bacterium]|nr:hypothetical protein [Chloroflexota bacterium]
MLRRLLRFGRRLPSPGTALVRIDVAPTCRNDGMAGIASLRPATPVAWRGADVPYWHSACRNDKKMLLRRHSSMILSLRADAARQGCRSVAISKLQFIK